MAPAVMGPIKERYVFEVELGFFVDHQDDLVARYGGKVLVIRGASVEAACDTPLEALAEGNRRFGPGAFMIQPCAPGAGAHTVNIATTGVMTTQAA